MARRSGASSLLAATDEGRGFTALRINHGADLRIINREGLTPKDVAMKGYKPNVKILFQEAEKMDYMKRETEALAQVTKSGQERHRRKL